MERSSATASLPGWMATPQLVVGRCRPRPARLGSEAIEEMLDFRRYEVLSFDCYGTLIDWESGILGALQPVFKGHGLALRDEEVLELYAEIEARAERGEAGRPKPKYRDVLREVMREFGERLGFLPTPAEIDSLVESLPNWRPFPDTVEALRVLKGRFKLAVISNVDDDLFASSARHLGVKFDWVITAEQAGSYKPAPEIFELALRRIGLPPERILHVAQSIYHDIIPAKRLGLATVWVNRSKGRKGLGRPPRAHGEPDLEVPDLGRLVSLMSF
jgi:2-haloacid dehalogenase